MSTLKQIFETKADDSMRRVKAIKAGTRLKFKPGAKRNFEAGTIDLGGKTGTVRMNTAGHAPEPEFISIQLDQRVPELDEWDNYLVYEFTGGYDDPQDLLDAIESPAGDDDVEEL